jgi:enoyl-CoA hydratase/carnithine racemase
MSDQDMIFSREGQVAQIILDRPDNGNMLTIDMVGRLTAHITDSGRDPEVKAILVAANGNDFCLGRDPSGAPEHAPRTAVEMRDALTSPILALYAAVRDAQIPVVAAVQGLANGFGCAMAAVCDVTIAADNSRFALPEMSHDLPPTLAMCAHIDRTMIKSIGWLVYSTGQIDAECARNLGFVSEIVPADLLKSQTDDFLAGLCERSRVALVTCKSYLANARLMETDKAADYAGNLLSVVMSSK